MVNTSPQIPSSFSPWPPHCKGDQQGCPPTEYGLWQEQADWVSVLITTPARREGPVGLRTEATSLKLTQLHPGPGKPAVPAGNDITEQGVAAGY